jgi:hypothetical protein
MLSNAASEKLCAVHLLKRLRGTAQKLTLTSFQAIRHIIIPNLLVPPVAIPWPMPDTEIADFFAPPTGAGSSIVTAAGVNPSVYDPQFRRSNNSRPAR